MAAQRRALALLIEDLAVYPRHAVDDAYVNDLVRSLDAGDTLPPPVIERSTGRVVDGFHRVRALRKRYEPATEIVVELVSYGSDAALLLDAVERNARHGRKLDKTDRARAVLMLEEAGVEEERIAVALHVEPKVVTTLRLHVATLPREATELPRVAIRRADGAPMVPLPRSVRHLDGQLLTVEQARVVGSAPGTTYLLLVRQLREALQAGLLPLERAEVRAALRELALVLLAVVPDAGSSSATGVA